jgi:hypothetical protein
MYIKREENGNAHVSGTEAQVVFYAGEVCAICSKSVGGRPIILTLSDGKKTLGAPLNLFNRSMNLAPQTFKCHGVALNSF